LYGPDTVIGECQLLRVLERSFKHFLSRLLKFVFRSAPPADFSFSTFKRVLVIRQHNQLGDMLCVVPLLRSLRQKLPDAHVTLMASPVNHDVMRNNRFVDRVINFDKSLGVVGMMRLIGELRREKFQLAVVPSTVSTSFTSDMLGFLSGAQFRIGAGSIDGNEAPPGFFFNLPVDLDWRSTPHRHQSQRNWDVCAQYLEESNDLTSEMTLTDDEKGKGRTFVEAVRGQHEAVIAFHPGAGKVPNRWPADRFAMLAEILSAEFHAAVLITSGPMDDEPIRGMVSQLNIKHTLVANKPIREVAAILASTDLVISNDTGIMHVGAAVGTPVLSLFGPTDAEQWAPKGERNRYIQGENGAIDSITVQQVLVAAREMLKNQGMKSRVIA
ncbi:MAG: glycosyltransferase family 9 protein, partial [Bacteroidota bacterium]